MFKAYEVKPGIYWVGAIEWNERYIHGFSMPEGSTNNAYLIIDEKVALIDTCTPGFQGELLERIADAVDPARIDYIVSNHGEKDHAGSIAEVLAAAPNAKLVTSDPQGLKILKRYYGDNREYLPVKSGDELSLGARTLQFIHTPMVHWPDNMVTYCPQEKMLFSNDAFGQFLATSRRFDDEVDRAQALACAKKYFANIVMPFAKQTAKAVAAVRSLGLDLIAPSHGVIWRSGIEDILDRYEAWCALEPAEAAVVVYASMYGATGQMARAITEAFMAAGIRVRLYDLQVSDISDIMTEVMDARYVAVGSSTHNKTVLPPMGEFLTYLKGLAPKGRCGIAFGSYGWAADGAREIAEVMEGAGFQLPLEPLTADWNEDAEGAQKVFGAIEGLIGRA